MIKDIFIKEKRIPNTPYTKIMYNQIEDGSCQCFKDCDCSYDKGKIVGTIYKYKHDLKDKIFYTFEACEMSYNSMFNNLTKLEK